MIYRLSDKIILKWTYFFKIIVFSLRNTSGNIVLSTRKRLMVLSCSNHQLHKQLKISLKNLNRGQVYFGTKRTFKESTEAQNSQFSSEHHQHHWNYNQNIVRWTNGPKFTPFGHACHRQVWQKQRTACKEVTPFLKNTIMIKNFLLLRMCCRFYWPTTEYENNSRCPSQTCWHWFCS